MSTMEVCVGWIVCALYVAAGVSADFASRPSHPCQLRNDGHRMGHQSELGCQRPPLAHIYEYFDAPTPRELWENQVKPYKPAVIRGALNGSPALTLWNDEYLVNSYGDQEVLVEKKFEDRKSEPKRMPIKVFLKNYHKENWYVVSLLPNAMRQDVKVPRPLMCSSFRSNLAELNLWIGTNGTRSILHYDADNIMHCVVSGWKDWILIHPENKPKLDMVLGRTQQGSGFFHLDVDSIDEDINPEVWDVPWEYVTLRAGDCLYLPAQYLHQVRSYERSISATFLFYPMDDFSDSDCKNVNLDEDLRVNDTYVYWTFENGQETVDMGYMNPLLVRDELINVLKATGKSKMNMRLFFHLAVLVYDEMALWASSSSLAIFKTLDKNGDKFVSLSELENADMEAVKQWCRDLDNPHGPTKSQLPTNKNYSGKTTEFAPRRSDRHADSKNALIFLQFLLKTKGINDQITFPEFKKWVEIDIGSAADAFLLLDKDFNGILTVQEVTNTTKKRLRDFSKMCYSITGTSIRGGGLYQDDVDANNLSYLKRLDDISELVLKDDDDQMEDIKKIKFNTLIQVLGDMKKAIKQGKMMDLEAFETTVKNSDLFHVFEIDHFDSKLLFIVLDKDEKGVISAEDLDYYTSRQPIAEIQNDMEEPQYATDILMRMLSSMDMVSEHLIGMKRRLESKNADQQQEVIVPTPKQEKTEL